MRKLIYAINVSLDGCCDHTKGGGGGSEEIHDHYTQLMRDVDLLAFGRKTYQLMVPFWPDIAKNHSGDSKAVNDFAEMFASKKLLVFSRTLHAAQGKDTRIVSTDPGEEILRLKQEPGKDILLGGVDIPSQLMPRGLIDEYHIIVTPTLAGEGRRLFEDVSMPQSLRLQLVESKTFKQGGVVLRYIRH
jgi:dihydrofolate reductase